jgi:hypothetical protein
MRRAEALASRRQRDVSTAAKEALNRYLRQYASQHRRKNIGRTHVAVEAGQSRVVGWWSLTR